MPARRPAPGPAPLGDDWLRWDPERIQHYPREVPAADWDLEPEPPRRRRGWPALEVVGLLALGFAVGLVAGAILVTAVLVIG